ncbi:MAG: hypothetical protein KDA45_13345, partial [Planctomycetales bacterium]|nr:hypothetical protein [Planctomycetales bacterium]
HVYSGGDDGKIHYWKVEDGARQRLLAHDGAVYGLRITGDFLFSYSADRTARQFTLSDHSLVRTFGGHDDWLTALAVDSQRQRLLTGTFSGHVRVLGLEDGSELSGFLAAPGLTPQPQPH